MLCLNSENGPKHRGSLKKKWPALMGIGRDFNAIQDKQRLICFKLQRNGAGN